MKTLQPLLEAAKNLIKAALCHDEGDQEPCCDNLVCCCNEKDKLQKAITLLEKETSVEAENETLRTALDGLIKENEDFFQDDIDDCGCYETPPNECAFHKAKKVMEKK